MARKLYSGRDPLRAQTIEELAGMARRRVPGFVLEYIEGGSEDERTLRWNREVFDRFRFVPAALVDTSARSAQIELLGRAQRSPLIVAPMGFTGLTYPDGDIALAKAATRQGIPFTLSSFSTSMLEEVAAQAGGRLWLQIYLLKDREITRQMLERAARAGYEAIMLTTDANILSGREWDKRNYRAPGKLNLAARLDTLRHPRWLLRTLRQGMPTLKNIEQFIPPHQRNVANRLSFVAEQLRPDITWGDVEWLRQIWPGKLLIKGILSPEDARRAIERGAEGLVLSNHGGRQLDGAISPMEILPQIAELSAGRAEVLIDSGFRRGTDVLKALALGASAVMVGRAALYGLAAGGEEGAHHALGLLRHEIERGMGLLGCLRVEELGARLHDAALAAPTPTSGAVGKRLDATVS
jgi:(S)-mandelate dehydrogenase